MFMQVVFKLCSCKLCSCLTNPDRREQSLLSSPLFSVFSVVFPMIFQHVFPGPLVTTRG